MNVKPKQKHNSDKMPIATTSSHNSSKPHVGGSYRKIALVRLIRKVKKRLVSINAEYYKHYYRKKYNEKMSVSQKIHMLSILMSKKFLDERIDEYRLLLKTAK